MKAMIITSRNAATTFKQIEAVLAKHKTFSKRTFYTWGLQKALQLRAQLKNSDDAFKPADKYLASQQIHYSGLRATLRPKKIEPIDPWDKTLMKIGKKRAKYFIKLIDSGDRIAILNDGFAVRSKSLPGNKFCWTIIQANQ